MTADSNDPLIDYLTARAVADEARSQWDHYLKVHPLLPVPIRDDADAQLRDLHDALTSAQQRELEAARGMRVVVAEAST